MSAIVRVKRRIDEEPLSAFVLHAKRRRLEEDSKTATALGKLSTLLKFAGTIKEQDDSATTQFALLYKEEAKERVLQKSYKPTNATVRARQELRQHQHEERFHVVNRLRTTVKEDNNCNQKSKEIVIFDIEKHTTNDYKSEDNAKSPLALSTSHNMTTNLGELSTSSAAAPTMPTDSDAGYVYDLYIPDNDQQTDYVDLMDDNYLSVQAFDDLVYEDCSNNDEDNDDYDSEDSNQEDYFSNDYPDEDDDGALYSNSDYDDIDDEDDATKSLYKDLEKFAFDDDDEESDDNGESCRALYVECVERYGLAYARYKSRILKNSKVKTDDKDIDGEDDYDPDFEQDYESDKENDEEHY